MLALARNALPAQEVIEVGPVIREVTDRWTATFRAAERELVSTVSPDLPGARVRPASIEQVLDVLLDNAMRHGAGETRITARPATGGLVVQIDDEGPGIDVALSDGVFERLNGQSTGIGLALARTLLEADGGLLLLSDPEHAEFRIVLAGSKPPSPTGP